MGFFLSVALIISSVIDSTLSSYICGYISSSSFIFALR